MDRVDVIKTRAEFSKMGTVWNAVHERCARRNVFLSWEWVSNWVDVYTDEGRLLVIVIHNEGEPRAIAPLFVEEEYFPGRVKLKVLRFLGSGEVCADHVDMMIAADSHAAYARRIWDELFGSLRGEWDVFEYYDTPADSPALQAFRDLTRKDKRCLSTERVGEGVCPYLSLPASWDEFLARCSGSKRYTITYSMKKLAEQGALEKRFCERPEEVASFMDAFISIHQRSWNERGEPGAFSRPRFEKFHRRVAESLLAKGSLFLCSFHLGGRHVGSFYGFDYAGTLYYYLMGVETNPAKKVKTGTVVIGHCIGEAIRRGCGEFDFLRGAEEYKYRWTSTDRRNPRVRFYNRTGKALAVLVCHSSYNGAKRVLRGLLGKHAARLRGLARR